MINTDYFKGKKVVIAGLARSGLACANLLHELGAEVSVTDLQDTEVVRLNSSKLKSFDIKFELGKHTKEFIQGRDLLIISPGIPDEALPVIWAKEFNITIISEIEVASILCPATIIAVTGSNGKTTTTTLIGKIIEASGKKVFVCGNIGNPFTGEVKNLSEGDFVSLEVSSFQLEKVKTFKPKIAVILNFSQNHLDRYKDMQEYLKAKKRIFMNQDKSDLLVLNRQDTILCDIAKEAGSQVVYFCGERGFNPDQAAVLSVAEILNIKREVCLNIFSGFKGLEHRMEYVSKINGIDFINDSKATTVESAVWALKNIKPSIILIAGGKDKGVDYSLVLTEAMGKVRKAILIGEAKDKIRSAFRNCLPVEDADTLPDAVKMAFDSASSGDSVLLSPMCSSFDMFKDYEERGRVFKQAVYNLVQRVS